MSSVEAPWPGPPAGLRTLQEQLDAAEGRSERAEAWAACLEARLEAAERAVERAALALTHRCRLVQQLATEKAWRDEAEEHVAALEQEVYDAERNARQGAPCSADAASAVPMAGQQFEEAAEEPAARLQELLRDQERRLLGAEVRQQQRLPAAAPEDDRGRSDMAASERERLLARLAEEEDLRAREAAEVAALSARLGTAEAELASEREMRRRGEGLPQVTPVQLAAPAQRSVAMEVVRSAELKVLLRQLHAAAEAETRANAIAQELAEPHRRLEAEVLLLRRQLAQYEAQADAETKELRRPDLPNGDLAEEAAGQHRRLEAEVLLLREQLSQYEAQADAETRVLRRPDVADGELAEECGRLRQEVQRQQLRREEVLVRVEVFEEEWVEFQRDLACASAKHRRECALARQARHEEEAERLMFEARRATLAGELAHERLLRDEAESRLHEESQTIRRGLQRLLSLHFSP